jgi:hypothetical protein
MLKIEALKFQKSVGSMAIKTMTINIYSLDHLA